MVLAAVRPQAAMEVYGVNVGMLAAALRERGLPRTPIAEKRLYQNSLEQRPWPLPKFSVRG